MYIAKILDILLILYFFNSWLKTWHVHSMANVLAIPETRKNLGSCNAIYALFCVNVEKIVVTKNEIVTFQWIKNLVL